MGPNDIATGALASQYDFLIIGSGMASVPAALVVRQSGRMPLIIEKSHLFGGSAAISAGVLFLPLNGVGKRAGVRDTFQLADEYMEACAMDGGRGATKSRRHAFLTNSPIIVEFLEGHGMRFVHPAGYSDYYEGERRAANVQGRCLVADIFDLRHLGPWLPKLRGVTALPPLKMQESVALLLHGRTLRSLGAMVALASRTLQNKLGRKLAGMGSSLQGRLLKMAVDANVPIQFSTEAKRFLVEDGRVVGVVAEMDGRACEIRAKCGVLIDSGGFAHDQTMREYYQTRGSSSKWSLAIPGDTGDMIKAARDLGADIDTMDLSWWVPVSVRPDGGKSAHTGDISKPHAILVDAAGSRYVNESTAYIDLGLAMFARNKISNAIPSWAIIDSQHRRKYRWAGARPGKPPNAWLKSGYMKVGNSIKELAHNCGIDADNLQATIRRFNGFARAGVDEDFHRGIGGFHRWYGDPTIRPNQNLGTIERAPFYAVEIVPGDVGTAGGVVTDAYGRVLREDGLPIAGLYAAGNSTASLVGRCYPGAGSTMGPALVFGFVAANHAMQNQ
jgi:3-oxosteroid 1-dehydrogenase